MILIYVLIVRHMRRHLFTTSTGRLKAARRRQRRETRLYCRILFLLGISFLMGIPYCVFFFLSMINGFSPAPPYADRICFLMIILGYSASMLLSFVFTDSVRNIFWSLFGKKPHKTRKRHVHRSDAISMRANTGSLRTTTESTNENAFK